MHSSKQFFCLSLALAALLLWCVPALGETAAETLPEKGRVLNLDGETAPLLSEPREDAAVLREWYNGFTFSILEEKNGYFHVLRSEGPEGWLSQRHAQPLFALKPWEREIRSAAPEGAALRRGPYPDSEILAVLNPDHTFPAYLTEDCQWYFLPGQYEAWLTGYVQVEEMKVNRRWEDIPQTYVRTGAQGAVSREAPWEGGRVLGTYPGGAVLRLIGQGPSCSLVLLGANTGWIKNEELELDSAYQSRTDRLGVGVVLPQSGRAALTAYADSREILFPLYQGELVEWLASPGDSIQARCLYQGAAGFIQRDAVALYPVENENRTQPCLSAGEYPEGADLPCGFYSFTAPETEPGTVEVLLKDGRRLRHQAPAGQECAFYLPKGAALAVQAPVTVAPPTWGRGEMPRKPGRYLVGAQLPAGSTEIKPVSGRNAGLYRVITPDQDSGDMAYGPWQAALGKEGANVELHWGDIVEMIGCCIIING